MNINITDKTKLDQSFDQLVNEILQTSISRLEVLKIPYDSFQFHSSELTKSENLQFIEERISENLVIIGVRDHLEDHGVIESLKSIFLKFSEHKFILFTSVESVDTIINYDNVVVIPWGGDIVRQIRGYRMISPVIDKNLDSSRIFISMNRHPRTHRAAAMSLILYYDLHLTNIISWNSNSGTRNDIVSKCTMPNIKELYLKGQNKFNQDILKQLYPGVTDHINNSVYPSGHSNDNIANFENNLQKYYRECFVEVINETTYEQPMIFLTEKTLNCFIGCCFPILISNPGTVKFLRQIGFDMFDHIVDHSYDEIMEPSIRIYRAFTDNLELLKNSERTKKFWVDNRRRFLYNANVARDDLGKFYTERALLQFEQAIRYFGLE